MLSIKVDAAVWSYEWYNTEIEIPVGDSINKYSSLPYAKLFKNGILLDDANINIVNKGDWLYYLTDVNTNKLGSYNVWYKAYENEKYLPGTCHNYKCLVTFNVVDKISPTITMLKDKIRIKKNTNYELSQYFSIVDNYDKELRIEYYDEIDESCVGSYDCTIVAVDTSNNQSSYKFTVEVYDDNIPKIEYLGEPNGIEIMIGSTPNLKDLFKATDESDGDITNRIELPVIDTSILGETTYDVKVSDLAGNYNSISIRVKIVDNVAPVISLYNNEITLDYYENLEKYNFYKHIEFLKDNGQNLDISKVRVDCEITNKVGKYHVYYSYNDGCIETVEVLTVNIISSIPPTITVNDITVLENERIDFSSFITVTDESDEFAYLTLIVNDENVDYTKKGKYLASAYAINSSGLSTIKTFYITVINDDELIGFFESEEVIYLVISVILIVSGFFITIKIKKNKRV
jgi:hypothetical protein